MAPQSTTFQTIELTKLFGGFFNKPDVDDMSYSPYPNGTIPKQPEQNIDPGRVRYEPLFVAMYEDCKKNEVTKNLRAIK
jgi:hypothetical protein